ncbi:MAG: hypothetical protein GX259_11460 [Bacteroidales bacterium]|jgi:hypothetical protein|nr:hypothetical protein [Bacteroidales bacterium]
MRILLFLSSLFFVIFFANAQNQKIVLTSIKKPQKTTDFVVGDKLIVYYSDTSVVSGEINSISKDFIKIDSTAVSIDKIQFINDYNKKSTMYKIGGGAMILGGVALLAGGTYLVFQGCLPFTASSFYLIPSGLSGDFVGIWLVVKGIDKIRNKGKEYQIGYKYTIEIKE